jgi:hypothetical protein
MYLLKNKGAVSDFLLIKDVVERHSEAESEEIDVMQPIPLYLGLMGTMIGIIAGVGLIALQGNIQNLSNISPLLGCVAVAMVASLFGISFTTFISWQSKGAKSEVEANKNTFYSWLQTELLPVLSGNAVSALSLLQSNLTEFNRTFSDNINTFDTVLSDVRTVSQEQASTIDALNRIDTKKVAQANISVLKELQKSTDNIDRFNSYIGQVNKYVAAIESLNNQLNAEMDQMEGRSEYIRGVVSSIDSALAEAMNKFGEGMRVFMESVKEESDKQMTSVQAAYDLQFKAYSEQIEELQKQLLERTKDFQKILDGISSLSATQRSISQLVDSSERNGDRLDRLVRSSSLGGGGSIPAGRRSNKVNTYLLAVITAVVVASGVTYIVGEIKTHYRPDYSFEEEYQAIEVNEDVPPVTDTLNVGEK